MVDVTLFTDPACPFAFSFEPTRMRLRWRYGDGLRWSTRLIVLTREPGEADKLATPFDGLQREHGMPIAAGPADRPGSCEPACRLVVAARLHGPAHADERLLRALRVRTMADRTPLDDPALLLAAIADAGLDAAQLRRWASGDDVKDALEADVAAARDPSPAARALDHKLGGVGGDGYERRYSAPSVELSGPAGRFSLPGFNPPAAYEAAIANLDPDLPRRGAPDDVAEVLAWAGVPLATAEVVAITGLGDQAARSALARVAECRPAGADAYWSAPSRS